jgi:hypothetical protein
MSVRNSQDKPTIAPGMEDDNLYEDATEEEQKAGDTTRVTTLSFDEHENGSRNSNDS